ncbi:MAG: bL17 family ribosomal protein, partial [Flavobacteriales bacterium]
DSTHSRRVCFSYLRDKYAVTELFREVAPKVSDRNGGYTRIIKTGHRLGDAAEMCMIELVDFNELYGGKEKKKTRRSRRGGAKKVTDAVAGAVDTAKEVAADATETAKDAVEDVKDAVSDATDTKKDDKKDA